MKISLKKKNAKYKSDYLVSLSKYIYIYSLAKRETNQAKKNS